MKHVWLVSMILALGGCQQVAGTQAAERVDMARSDSIIPPAISRPIIEPNGNVVQCTAYPGPGAAGACIQQ